MKHWTLKSAGKISLLSALLLISLIFLGGCDGKSKTEFVGFPQSFADLAEKIRPAMVNISTTSTVKVPGNPFKHFFGPEGNGPFDDFFKHFFGDMPDRELRSFVGARVPFSETGRPYVCIYWIIRSTMRGR